MSTTNSEIIFLQHLLGDIGVSISIPTPYYDNKKCSQDYQ